MTDAAPTGPDEPTGPSGEHCPLCGAELVTGTTDFADTPDETSDTDLERAELRPGQMVRTAVCPTPGCPGPDTGAVL
jgi:hypothetical protein